MNTKNYHKIFKERKCCVLIPTFNNSAVLPEVIKNILQYTDNIIVVNDGSADNTLDIIKSFENIEHLTYEKKRR